MVPLVVTGDGLPGPRPRTAHAAHEPRSGVLLGLVLSQLAGHAKQRWALLTRLTSHSRKGGCIHKRVGQEESNKKCALYSAARNPRSALVAGDHTAMQDQPVAGVCVCGGGGWRVM